MSGLENLGSSMLEVSVWLESGINALAIFAMVMIFRSTSVKPVSEQLSAMGDIIRDIAEGGGNLRQRIDLSRTRRDESGDLARWTNSFIDSLAGMVGQVLTLAADCRQASEQMGCHDRS